MGHCCARCMNFGDWKLYKKPGAYKDKPLCGTCTIVVNHITKSRKNGTIKKTTTDRKRKPK